MLSNWRRLLTILFVLTIGWPFLTFAGSYDISNLEKLDAIRAYRSGTNKYTIRVSEPEYAGEYDYNSGQGLPSIRGEVIPKLQKELTNAFFGSRKFQLLVSVEKSNYSIIPIFSQPKPKVKSEFYLLSFLGIEEIERTEEETKNQHEESTEERQAYIWRELARHRVPAYRPPDTQTQRREKVTVKVSLLVQIVANDERLIASGSGIGTTTFYCQSSNSGFGQSQSATKRPDLMEAIRMAIQDSFNNIQ